MQVSVLMSAISQVGATFSLLCISSTNESERYWAIASVNAFMAYSSPFFLNFDIHDSKNGFQPISVSLMKRTPPLDTVAGVAFFKWDTSKNILISGVSGILSCDTRVSTLLSSMTVLSDSIHSGSTSPSNTIHL